MVPGMCLAQALVTRSPLICLPPCLQGRLVSTITLEELQTVFHMVRRGVGGVGWGRGVGDRLFHRGTTVIVR